MLKNNRCLNNTDFLSVAFLNIKYMNTVLYIARTIKTIIFSLIYKTFCWYYMFMKVKDKNITRLLDI